MTPRPGEKKAGNGVRLLGLSFPSEGPFFFLKADATTAALVQLNPAPVYICETVATGSTRRSTGIRACLRTSVT
jgi:hypothetical protein